MREILVYAPVFELISKLLTLVFVFKFGHNPGVFCKNVYVCMNCLPNSFFHIAVYSSLRYYLFWGGKCHK